MCLSGNLTQDMVGRRRYYTASGSGSFINARDSMTEGMYASANSLYTNQFDRPLPLSNSAYTMRETVRGVELSNPAYTMRERVRGVELPVEDTASTGNDTRIGMQRVGMGLALLGGLANYRANDAYLKAQSNVLDSNIAQTEQQIYQVGEQGATAANDARRQGRQVMASQRAAFGANGVGGGDTVQRVQGGTAAAAETNAQRHLYNAMLEQWGLQQNIENMRAQQRNIELQRQNNRTNSLLGTATTLAKMYFGWGGVT